MSARNGTSACCVALGALPKAMLRLVTAPPAGEAVDGAAAAS
jgi:hypothetical protein